MPKKSTKSDNTTDECDICFEIFNKSTHKPIECMYCHKTTCVKCIRTYLLTTYDEPHCMKCKTAWERDFWMDKVPKAFINDELKTHREKILLEREKSLMPVTQHIVERIVRTKRIKEAIVELEKKLPPINTAYSSIMYSPTLSDDEKYAQLKELSKQRAEIYFEIEFRNRLLYNPLQQQSKVERAQFVRACPVTDCRGFLSSRWKCGICENYTCKDCHEVIGKDIETTNHKCKQENIETAKLLDKDSRPCPKCASLIFKISGCDQMFCTQCNTAFSWNTGLIITNGQIHNPHYFDYLQRNPNAHIQENNGGGACNEMPNYYDMLAVMKRLKITDQKLTTTIATEFIRAQYHNANVEMRRYERRQNETQDLRVQYMLNEMTEDKFKRAVQIMEKAYHKGMALLRIMQLFNTASIDIANRMKVAKTQEEFMMVWSEVDTLKDYVMEQMKIIAKRFNCKTPQLRKFQWTRMRPVKPAVQPAVVAQPAV